MSALKRTSVRAKPSSCHDVIYETWSTSVMAGRSEPGDGAAGRPELDRHHDRIAGDLVALVLDLPDLGFQVIAGETDVVDARTRGPSGPVYCSRPARAKLRTIGSRR